MSNKLPAYALTRKAHADMEDIWRYTAENWSVAQEDKYTRELVTAFGLISTMPHLARERTEFSPPVRIHLHAGHVIVYIANDKYVEIVRILGGRQDWMAILNDAES